MFYVREFRFNATYGVSTYAKHLSKLRLSPILELPSSGDIAAYQLSQLVTM